jgi:hypothetical protein
MGGGEAKIKIEQGKQKKKFEHEKSLTFFDRSNGVRKKFLTYLLKILVQKKVLI